MKSKNKLMFKNLGDGTANVFMYTNKKIFRKNPFFLIGIIFIEDDEVYFKSLTTSRYLVLEGSACHNIGDLDKIRNYMNNFKKQQNEK